MTTKTFEPSKNQTFEEDGVKIVNCCFKRQTTITFTNTDPIEITNCIFDTSECRIGSSLDGVIVTDKLIRVSKSHGSKFIINDISITAYKHSIMNTHDHSIIIDKNAKININSKLCGIWLDEGAITILGNGSLEINSYFGIYCDGLLSIKNDKNSSMKIDITSDEDCEVPDNVLHDYMKNVCINGNYSVFGINGGKNSMISILNESDFRIKSEYYAFNLTDSDLFVSNNSKTYLNGSFNMKRSKAAFEIKNDKLTLRNDNEHNYEITIDELVINDVEYDPGPYNNVYMYVDGNGDVQVDETRMITYRFYSLLNNIKDADKTNLKYFENQFSKICAESK